jgi:SAM-dependent methyltransferase
LEIGCGTGRIFLKLLEEGIDITGIDTSEKMLDILKHKAHEDGREPDVHKESMTDFKMEKKFRLIFVPYRSFLHLKDDKERKKALENFMEHLDKSGRLIIHTYNPSFEELEMEDEYHLFESEDVETKDGRKCKVEWHLKYESVGKIAHYRVDLGFEDGEKQQFLMDLYFIWVSEMDELLYGAGFKNIRIYCGFDYSGWDENCSEALWFAEK